MIVNTVTLCDILGVSERIVTRWVNAGMPLLYRGGTGRGDESEYDSVKVVEWLRGRSAMQAARERPDAALKSVQTRLAELDLAERAGKLLGVEEVQPAIEAAILAARAELLGLGPRLKATLDARYGIDLEQQLIDDEIHHALTKLSEKPPVDEMEQETETLEDETEAEE